MPGLQEVKPVTVGGLFNEVLVELLDLLSGLAPVDWRLPTVCTGWDVKDVARHLLGGDIGNLSRRRDAFVTPLGEPSWEALVSQINRWNEGWVHAGRRRMPPMPAAGQQFGV